MNVWGGRDTSISAILGTAKVDWQLVVELNAVHSYGVRHASTCSLRITPLTLKPATVLRSDDPVTVEIEACRLHLCLLHRHTATSLQARTASMADCPPAGAVVLICSDTHSIAARHSYLQGIDIQGGDSLPVLGWHAVVMLRRFSGVRAKQASTMTCLPDNQRANGISFLCP